MIARIKKSLRRRSGTAIKSFRERYRETEQRRAAMIERLQRLGDDAAKHPAHRRALTLLNETFRKSKLTQRAAVLQAAEWLIDVLETLTMIA